VVLTFDDGPLSGPTQSILRTLDAHCVRATFFMVGSMARADPDLVRQVADAGHTIGIHTWSHANLSGLSRAAAIRQIRRGYGAVSNALGDRRPAAFFRFPYLAGTASLRRYLSENALTVFGSPVIDSEDYRTSSGDRIVRRIMARLEQRGRGVILMHDIKNATAAMLPSLLDALDENGYSVVHLVSAAMIPSSFGLDPGPGEPQTASRGSSSSGASARLHTLSAVGDRQPNHGLRPDDIR
jgi:peptidoglycan/xylan/chitin deacetylase (PgdA/CDA1 family)